MNFNQLSWGAVCFYYRLSGDNKYCRMMRDVEFLDKLRRTPELVVPAEFEQKVLLDHVNIENYDLLVGHKLATRILERIAELHPILSSLNGLALTDCDLTDNDVLANINSVYSGLYSLGGLWLTGASKIAHLLNDRLFVILNLDISNHFNLMEGDTSLLQWLKVTQRNAIEVKNSFDEMGLKGSPADYLSEKIGYTQLGIKKSLVKFLDEYFWLRFGDNLPIPPRWVPPITDTDPELSPF